MNKRQRSELWSTVRKGLLAAGFFYILYIVALLLLRFVLVPTWNFVF